MKKLAIFTLALLAAMGARAGVVSYYFQNDLAMTEINQSGSLGLFDTKLGDLTHVELLLNGRMQTSITVINHSNQAQNVRANVTVDLDFTSNLSSLNALLTADGSFLMVANSGRQTLGALQQWTSDPLRAYQTRRHDADLHNLWADFSRAGGGKFDLACSSQTSLSVVGAGGNIQATQQTGAACDAQVIYTYQDRPVQVPEPASLALVGLALAGAGFSTRRRRRA